MNQIWIHALLTERYEAEKLIECWEDSWCIVVLILRYRNLNNWIIDNYMPLLVSLYVPKFDEVAN